ncbi:hypothetical protein SEPCBS57363_003889 [Sporothrix epigloea]|uniref:MFS transporter, AGZA family, xanthine/uracil permease n=1 Tax=Sporothrix epigloea TaxID=1892477 RepID=A0ABP0DR41_9PEZI
MPSSRPSRKNPVSEWITTTTDFLSNTNEAINRSTFGRIFRLRGSGHPEEICDANFATEIRAGLTTFATMAYIIAVNASILVATNGTCECADLKQNNVCSDPKFQTCLDELHRDFITATAIVSGLSSITFGFFTNMPVALAPGMGLNAYFTYQVVGVAGSGPVPYRIALTAVFVEGFIFLILALTGMRQWLIRIIPGTLKTASGVGIGMFLALAGMSYASGIGIITGGGSATPLTIGGCPPEDLDIDGTCMANGMRNPKMWLGIFSGIITALLMAFRVKAAIIIGIAITTFISWPRNTSVTYFPDTAEGDTRWDFFKQVVAFTPIKHILAVQQWDLGGANGAHFAMALFTFLYVDIVDCTATLYAMARFSGKTGPDGDFPRSTIAYCTDALFISIGSLFGCSPCTAFIESGAGITEGGRTGLTAMVTGLCFIISVFFAPIFASIPPWATGTTLILVGCLMIRQVTFINWSYIGDAIPSFVTIAFMPFSYSVAYGLMAGLFVYIALNSLIWIVIRVTGGTIEPREYDLKEYWTWKPAGKKPAVFRLFARDSYWGDKESLHEDDDAFIFPGSSNAQPLDNLRGMSASSTSEAGLPEKSTRRIDSAVESPPKAVVAIHPHP